MRIQTIHKNRLGEVLNESTASGIRVDGPDGERLEVHVTDGGVQISVSGFGSVSSGGDSHKGAFWVTLHPHHRDPARRLICYQCERETTWLAPDSRCGDCTRLTADEVRGE